MANEIPTPMEPSGRVLPLFRGDYADNAVYENPDIVLYNNSSYVAKQATIGNPPPTDALSNDYWQMVAKGIIDADVSDATVEFEEASKRENIGSRETTRTLFGKIKKWLSDLKPFVFNGTTNSTTVEKSEQYAVDAVQLNPDIPDTLAAQINEKTGMNPVILTADDDLNHVDKTGIYYFYGGYSAPQNAPEVEAGGSALKLHTLVVVAAENYVQQTIIEQDGTRHFRPAADTEWHLAGRYVSNSYANPADFVSVSQLDPAVEGSLAEKASHYVYENVYMSGNIIDILNNILASTYQHGMCIIEIHRAVTGMPKDDWFWTVILERVDSEMQITAKRNVSNPNSVAMYMAVVAIPNNVIEATEIKWKHVITESDITQSAAVTVTGQQALDAVEKNAAIEGTMAYDIGQINSNLADTIKKVYTLLAEEINQIDFSQFRYGGYIVFTYRFTALVWRWGASLRVKAIEQEERFVNNITSDGLVMKWDGGANYVMVFKLSDF